MKRSWFAALVLVAVVAAATAQNSRPPSAPKSGGEHPFAKSIPDVSTTPRSKGVSRPGAAQGKSDLTEGIAYPTKVRFGNTTIPVTLEASSATPKAALDYLARNLTAYPVNLKKRTDLQPFLSERGQLMKSQPEVRLPTIKGPNGQTLAFAWTDGWTMVRPNVIRLRPDYKGFGQGDRRDGDVGVATAALTGRWNHVEGTLQCQAPGEAAQPLAFVTVDINGVSVNADASGGFSIPGEFLNVDRLTIRYDGRVTPAAGVAVGPRMSVMNDFHNPRSEKVDIPSGETVDGALRVGTLTLSSLDCELFEIGAGLLSEFHNATGIDPPAADDFRIKRWEGVYDGVPYTFFDYIVVNLNFRRDYGWREARRVVLQHEFGHALRHAADGDSGHWGWDNFRWVYARNHSGDEVFNEQYAFNEGWANYWECTFLGRGAACPAIFSTTPGSGFLDWNELRVGERLMALSRAPGVGPAVMLNVLIANAGEIHTLMEFERKYCARTSAPGFCSGSRPTRVKPDCPPGFTNDGATCRLNNILAKASFGRGVGGLPIGCRSGERDAGLCYTPCPPGFDGVGPVCWRRCPAGMHDDGAFCRRDVSIIASNNRACPWYDACGLTFARGCSTCPAGFQNDGCTCRVDAWIFAKESFGRGVGELPTRCPSGQEYDAGLCYPVCRAGFTGVGPVCWGSCPAGFADHGATCYKEPSILVRF